MHQSVEPHPFVSKDHIKELRDVAFRKIGRNLVNFQQFERSLKLIIVRSDLRGYASEAAKILRNKDKDIDRKPLGWLVKNFFETLYSNHSSQDGPAHERDEAWMSISLKIKSTKGQFGIEGVNSANSSKRETCWSIGCCSTSIQSHLRAAKNLFVYRRTS